MPSILFICTGNIFRSVTAEYALRARLTTPSSYRVGSAGIEARQQEMHPLIRARLHEKGADLTQYQQRQLTRALLDSADIPVAMGLNHRDFILATFGREIHLFNEICYNRDEPVLDIHEAIPDWRANQLAAQTYAASVIDYIWDAMPTFFEKVERILRQGGQ